MAYLIILCDKHFPPFKGSRVFIFLISKYRFFFHGSSELSKVKVIDMTRPHQRVYDGYEAALTSSLRHSHLPDHPGEVSGPDAEAKAREKRIEGRFFEVPVLCHNVDLVVKSTEDEIRRLDRGARFEEDRAAGLEHEIDRLTEVGLIIFLRIIGCIALNSTVY